MSIRNMDADLAANKLNELFHLHRYEDCVLFINRLSHLTIKMVISQISIEMYLSRLPYTIEIFEALYAKIFIMDPDNFPVRSLQPERLIDKMVAYFSLLSDHNKIEPIDGAKMLDSFENVIRIISYVQPNLYSRLLYFKYAIDKALLRFERDLALYNTHLMQPMNQLKTCGITNINHQSGPTYFEANALILANTQSIDALNIRTNHKANALANALLISRASNMQTCESIRNELIQTVHNCDRALIRLNEYISNLKSQKIFKEVQFYLNQENASSTHNNTHRNKDNKDQEQETNDKSPTKTSSNNTNNNNNDTNGSTNKKASSKRNSSNNDRSKSNRSAQNRSESVNNYPRNKYPNNETEQQQQQQPISHSSTMCLDFIQNRLYLNKAMMNTVDQFLQSIKLQQLLANIYEKIDLDKEILLVFSHLKREEKYLNSLEPIEPLFRRYSIGFERCIQIWRRKCSADSLLLFNDRFNTLGSPLTNQSTTQMSTIGRMGPIEQLYVVNNDESNQIDQIQSSYTSSARAVPTMPAMALLSTSNLSNTTPLIITKSQHQQRQELRHKHASAAAAAAAAALNSSDILNSNIANQYSNLIDNYLNEEKISQQSQPRSHRYFSEVNLYSNSPQMNYNTMPAKLKSQMLNATTRDTSFVEKPDSSNKRDSTCKQSYQSHSNLNKLASSNQHTGDLTIASSNSFMETNLNGEDFRRKEEFYNKPDQIIQNEITSAAIVSVRLNGTSNDEEAVIYEKTQILDKSYLDEIENLNKELANAKETINELKKNENKLKEQLEVKQKELNKLIKSPKDETNNEQVSNNEQSKSDKPNESNEILPIHKLTIIYQSQYTNDLINFYVNLNKQYRLEAYESLDSVKEIQNMNEFKIKLLFSVVILSYRYVKLYVRDLKRKVKSILQINDRNNSVSNERSNSQKGQMTPTIMVQKPEEIVNDKQNGGGGGGGGGGGASSTKSSTNEFSFIEDSSNKSISQGMSRYGSRKVSTDRKKEDAENSSLIIENALNRYLQVAAITKSFDLNKIVEDVKEQLWNTLYDYPLKECQELNSYINESVKTCWSLVNHQPQFKLDYMSTKFDQRLHERSETSNKLSEQIIQYVWPSLVDTSNNNCISKGIVVT